MVEMQSMQRLRRKKWKNKNNIELIYILRTSDLPHIWHVVSPTLGESLKQI